MRGLERSLFLDVFAKYVSGPRWILIVIVLPRKIVFVIFGLIQTLSTLRFAAHLSLSTTLSWKRTISVACGKLRTRPFS